MYLTTAWSMLKAYDIKSGEQLWAYDPKVDRAKGADACCDVVNRGAAYADGLIFYNTLDNLTVAGDAETGKPLWKAKLGDINKGETMTMAPIVVKGKVLVGSSGGEMGDVRVLTGSRPRPARCPRRRAG